MRAHETEERKTAQENFTRAMRTLFRTPKAAIQERKAKPASKETGKRL